MTELNLNPNTNQTNLNPNSVDMSIINRVLTKAIKEYDLHSESYPNDLIVAFITVDLIREHLSPTPVPVYTPQTPRSPKPHAAVESPKISQARRTPMQNASPVLAEVSTIENAGKPSETK